MTRTWPLTATEPPVPRLAVRLKVLASAGVPVTRRHFEGVDELEVESVAMPVLSATTLMIDKMRAMEEHACNLSAALPAARAVREQIDWDKVRGAVEDNPYGSAFLYLLDRLGITR